MTKDSSIIAKAPPPSAPVASAQAAVNASQHTSNVDSLRRRISTNNAAAQPFQRPQRHTGAFIGSPRNSTDWSALQDFTACPSVDTEKYFTCFTDARRFAKNAPTIPNDPRETLAAAQLHRSEASAQLEQNAAAQGVANTSALVRMQKVAVSAEYQKRFFEDYAARNGYAPVETPINDETLLEAWKQFKHGDLTEREFFALLNDVPREQRVSVALNLTRLVASDHLKDYRVDAERSLGRLDEQINETQNALDEARPGSAEEKSLTAKLNNLRAAYDAKISIFTTDGMEAGKEALEDLLRPAPQNTPNRQGNQASWNPCENWDDVDNIIAVFHDACEDYNAQTELRTNEMSKQQDAMRDSALPLLSMPLELRDGALAKSVHREAQQNFLESHGLAEPQTRAGKVWRALKVVGAALGYVFGLGWLLSSVHDALLPTLSQQERMRLASEHADRTLWAFLQNRNRTLAEEWVKDQYSNPSASGADGLWNPSNDPHGLFAAILNPSAQAESNDFMAREKLIRDVTDQLHHAAQSDILAEKEKLAATLGVPLTDESVVVADEDYLTDGLYLQEIARSIVDGVAAGLQWSAQQQSAQQYKADSSSATTAEL